MQTVDVRSLSLPPRFCVALTKLIIRTLEVRSLQGAQRLSAAVLGETPTFGQLKIPSVGDWNEAIKTEVMSVPAVRVSELVDLIASISPTTPMCDACGEFAVNQVGGAFMTLSSGDACPFCPSSSGHMHLEPMVLCTINWVTGELVSPEIEYDLRSRSGAKIPLTDNKIVEWAGGIDADLQNELLRANVSLRGLLAYMNLRLRAFAKPEEAAEYVAYASLSSAWRMRQMIDDAARFLDERQITNLPHKLYLSDGRRRDEFTPLTIGGRRLLIDHQIGTGDKCDVFLARTDDETPERLVVKRLREAADADLFDHEIATLARLANSTVRGSEFFNKLVPQVVFAESSRTENPTIAFRARGTFQWTLADVMREYPDGVDFKTAVWIWKRVLMLLDWIHANHLVHGAVLPEHILLDVENHGARLIDWGYAQPIGSSLKAFSVYERSFYPDEVLSGSPLDPQVDIAMVTRCVIAILGGDSAGASLPSSVPDAFRTWMLEEAGHGSLQTVCNNAFALHERVSDTAKRVFGPPTFHPFFMPRPLAR